MIARGFVPPGKEPPAKPPNFPRKPAPGVPPRRKPKPPEQGGGDGALKA